MDAARGATDAATDGVDGVVIDAFAFVCELDAAELSGGTTMAEINADSLVLVATADLIEEQLGAVAAGWRIDDGDLGRIVTIGELIAIVRRLDPAPAA